MKKETPILFSSEMVRAILDGKKTMTRRVIGNKTALEWLKPGMFTPDFVADPENSFSKYGYADDLLWVKETHFAYGQWVKNGFSKSNKQKFKFKDFPAVPVRFMDNPPDKICRLKSETGYFKRPAIFMFKKHARIWLKVKNVRVERLQAITDKDAIKEGVDGTNTSIPGYATDRFKKLWGAINGKPRKDGVDISWMANPLVWCVEFKKVER